MSKVFKLCLDAAPHRCQQGLTFWNSHLFHPTPNLGTLASISVTFVQQLVFLVNTKHYLSPRCERLSPSAEDAAHAPGRSFQEIQRNGRRSSKHAAECFEPSHVLPGADRHPHQTGGRTRGPAQPELEELEQAPLHRSAFREKGFQETQKNRSLVREKRLSASPSRFRIRRRDQARSLLLLRIG